MNKFLGGGFWLLAGVFILGIVLGVNWAEYEEGWRYFWHDGHGGTVLLKDALMKDKSERLAFIIVTEQNQYQLCSLENVYAYVELRRKQ